MVAKGCLVRFVMQTQVSAITSGKRLPGFGDRETFTNGKFCPAFRHKGKGQGDPAVPVS